MRLNTQTYSLCPRLNRLTMSMKQDSIDQTMGVKTGTMEGGPCAGGVSKSQPLYRSLKSLSNHKVIRVKTPQPAVAKVFDPTAWYVVQTKRYSEEKAQTLLNTPEGFVNATTGTPYHVEAYAAIQTGLRNKVVIHGKLFVRVDESHRIDVLRQCPYLKGFMKDPSLARTANDFTDFARVPDQQIQRLRAILEMAEGPVAYDEVVPQAHDNIQVIGGLLSRTKLFQDLKGEISQTNGKQYATVILDSLGSFKFKLPVKHLGKLTKK